MLKKRQARRPEITGPTPHSVALVRGQHSTLFLSKVLAIVKNLLLFAIKKAEVKGCMLKLPS